MVAKKINSAIPGLQAADDVIIAARRRSPLERSRPSSSYQQQVVDNAVVLVDLDRARPVVSGRTESHLMLVDLRPKGLTGKEAEAVLQSAHMT